MSDFFKNMRAISRRALKKELPPIVIDLLQKCLKDLTQKDLRDLERIHKHILKNLGQLQEE